MDKNKGVDDLLKAEGLQASQVLDERSMYMYKINTKKYLDILSIDRLCWVVDADFGYPADMDKFVPYMPAEDEDKISNYTKDERIQHLPDNFQAF